jgi:hypothetical protein
VGILKWLEKKNYFVENISLLKFTKSNSKIFKRTVTNFVKGIVTTVELPKLHIENAFSEYVCMFFTFHTTNEQFFREPDFISCIVYVC